MPLRSKLKIAYETPDGECEFMLYPGVLRLRSPPALSRQLANELLCEPGTPAKPPIHTPVVRNTKHKCGCPSRCLPLAFRVIPKTDGFAWGWIYKHQIFKMVRF